jgi:Mg2+-importing ATPase
VARTQLPAARLPTADRAPIEPLDALAQYWSRPADQVLETLQSSPSGLRQPVAAERLQVHGPNTLTPAGRVTGLTLLGNQFKSPLVLILVFAATISILVGDWHNAIIVLTIVLGSATLGFIQEYRASDAIEKLRSTLTLKSLVIRGGQEQEIPSSEIVPGDIVLLSAGSLVPADGLVVEAHDLFVNQAVLTGEVYPVEKRPGTVEHDATLIGRVNCVFMGTNVRSGTARVLIVHTAKETVFGQIAERLKLRPPQTEFERGVQGFGFLLTRVMLVIVVVVLCVNILHEKPALDSLLFALALAVGLTPELLPAIISITLAHGAVRMAKSGVLVRRLSAIENFGSMQVLCTDKTGTLTEGTVLLSAALDADGQQSALVLRYAYLNALFETGLSNPLDDALRLAGQHANLETAQARKLDEIPYDFIRKRLSIVVDDGSGQATLITKGALENVLQTCSAVQHAHGSHPLDDAARDDVHGRFRHWSGQGFRVLGVAVKHVETRAAYSREDEHEQTFVGFLLFFDPPKCDAAATIADLQSRGVELKVITGDNPLVTQHIAQAVNLPVKGLLTGREIQSLGDEALWYAAERTTIFAEVDPHQKERIILALKQIGFIVGYLGDGINDAPALHAADVGISVNTAVDVARDAADLVLLRPDLDILRDGIDDGRRTFANTLKYILATASANFGNMFSLAAASFMLPFLPLLAAQILLNNFLSDIPAATIAGDNVDPEWVAAPRRWNNRFVSRYMVLFGLVSSIFDFLTFGTLLFVFNASVEMFRTGWFVESLLTELVIALVVRTRRPFFRSRPGTLLLASTLVVTMVALVLPYLPVSSLLGFVPLPAPLLLMLIGITCLYVVATEIAKSFFYARLANGDGRG